MNYCYLVQSFPSNFARIHEMSLSILASLEPSSICSIDSIRRLSDATSFFIRAIVLITERRTVAISGLTDVAIEMIDAKSILTQLRTSLCRIQFSFIGCGSSIFRCSSPGIVCIQAINPFNWKELYFIGTINVKIY